jgi:hypothetical protein
MRKLTKEEDAIFKQAMRSTSGHKLHGLQIILWGLFCQWRQWVFVDCLSKGMHWWAAYTTAKNAKRYSA